MSGLAVLLLSSTICGLLYAWMLACAARQSSPGAGRRTAVIVAATFGAWWPLGVVIGLVLVAVCGLRGPQAHEAHFVAGTVAVPSVVALVCLRAVTRSWTAVLWMGLGATAAAALVWTGVRQSNPLCLFSGIPVWMLTAAAVIGTWTAMMKRTARGAIGRCHSCGYDLAGLTPESPCPECGAARRLPA